MKVSKEELKELIKLYSGMDKLSRAIWLGSGSLLLGKEMTEKEQMMVKPQKTAQEVKDAMDKTEYEKLCELDRQLQEAICVKRRHQSAGIYDPADEETCKKAADAYNDQYVRVYSRCKY